MQRMCSDYLFDPRVAVFDAKSYNYPESPPFNPPMAYPEYPFERIEIDETNFVYDAVRSLFTMLDLDRRNFGSKTWNPLGCIVRPGDNVVLKPNLVVSDHPEGVRGIQASVVHGSLVRALIDYVFIANRGQGRITVADSPIKEVDFARILDLTGIGPTVAYLQERHALPLAVVDFRDLQVNRNSNRVMTDGVRLPGDPSGYRVIDLKHQSMLREISQHARRFRSTASFYENAIPQAHDQTRHLYSIPNRILQADVVISLAKLKTHRKAGVTLSLKNMVGITNEKRWLPHHRVGSPSQGGDLFADSTRLDVKMKELVKDVLVTHSWGRSAAQHIGIPMFKLYSRLMETFVDRQRNNGGVTMVEDGDWYGNDTVWRMVLDLNTLLFYCDQGGMLCDHPQRRYFSIIDGIIGGMEEGPLKPRPHPCGVLVAGFNPVAVDMLCTRLMGFDYTRVPKIHRAAERDWLPLGQFTSDLLEIVSNENRWQRIFESSEQGLAFEPSAGWRGHLGIGDSGSVGITIPPPIMGLENPYLADE